MTRPAKIVLRLFESRNKQVRAVEKTKEANNKKLFDYCYIHSTLHRSFLFWQQTHYPYPPLTHEPLGSPLHACADASSHWI